MDKLKRSTRLALGGVITSLCTVFNIFAVIVPASGYVLPALSGMLVLIPTFESGYKLGLMVYFCTSVLSLLLCADKFPAFEFLFLLGFYPLMKLKVDSLPKIPYIIKFLIKTVIFNVITISDFWIQVKLFNIPEESFYVFGVYLPQVLLIMGNFIFLMYDRCVDNFVKIYKHVLRDKLRNIMKI